MIATFALCAGCGKSSKQEVPISTAPITTLTVGHVGHDHHLALFVAADNAAQLAENSGVALRVVKDKKLYELYDNGKKIANVEVLKVGGGSKMPTSLAQASIDVGLGGVAPVLAAIDKGAPVTLISPLHNKGDMLVTKPELNIKSWEEFVDYVKKSDIPVRVGYKSPMAVAKVIFEDALSHAGLTFSGDMSKTDVDVHMVNVKGGGKLNISLSGGLIDAYAGNNPFAAIAEVKGLGHSVCELESLPPGRFKNHPCCCIAANSEMLVEKSVAITALLTVLQQATDLINADTASAAECAGRWIGTSAKVEMKSLPTSSYSMDDSEKWHSEMSVWLNAMNDLGLFKDKLKGLKEKAVASIAYDLRCLHVAQKRLER